MTNLSTEIVSKLRNDETCHDGDIDAAADLLERLAAAHAETIAAARRVIDRHDKGLLAGKSDSLVIEQLRLCVENHAEIE